MSQYDFGTIDTAETDGGELASLLQSFRTAVNSLHSGTARPSYVVANMMWLDTTATPWIIKMYDGAADITLGFVNATTDFANFFTSSPVINKTANATIALSEREALIYVDATAAPYTMTLPSAATATNGFKITVIKKNSNANTVTVARDGADTIAGATSWVLTVQNDQVTLFSDGTSAWLAIGNVPGAISTAKLGDDITAAGKALLTGADAAAQRTTLGIDPAGQSSGRNTQTGTAYTLVLGDKGKLVTMNNAAANTLTIPANATVAFPVDSRIDIAQLGAGNTTIAITTDTLRSSGSKLKIYGQYSGATLLKIATTEWLMIGDLKA